MIAFEPGLREYLNQLSLHPVLNREQERELFQRMEASDDAARQRLVESNLRFVIKIAMQYAGQGVPLSDLIQEGNVGLLEAVGKFEWRKGFRFSTYAAFWIREAIQKAVRKQSSLILLPVRKARLMGKIAETIRQLRHRGIVDASPAQVAEEMGMPEDKIEELMLLRESVLSLDQEPDGEGLAIGEMLACPNQKHPSEELEKQEIRFHVGEALKFLSEREREVIRLRFGISTGRSMSLRKASRMVGLSQEGVRRVERRALEKLQRPALLKQVVGLL